jgi:hypothetical protein
MKRHLSIAASVALLNRHRHPTHVTRLVVAAVVYAVERVQRRWPPTNVFQKGREALAPSVAHLYSSCAVVPVLLVLGVVAPCSSGIPDRLFCCSGHAVPVIQPLGALAIQAAATFDSAAPQVSAERTNVDAATVAAAAPATVADVTLNHEPMESLPCEIAHLFIIRAAAIGITTDLNKWL